MKSWRTYLVVAIAIVLAFYIYRASTRRTVTGLVSDLSGKPIAGAMIQVVLVDGRDAHIPKEGTFLTKSNSNGQFQIVLVKGRDKHYGILADKEQYKPEWTMFNGYPPQESLKLALRADIPPQAQKYRVADGVIARDGEWCNAEIVTIGTASSPTTQGSQDMSGKIEVKWDDWGSTQWLPASQIRPRPVVPLTSPMRCPSLSKQELADYLRQDVNKLLGR